MSIHASPLHIRPRPSPDQIARFAAIVGDRNALIDPHDQAPYLREWRDLYRGVTPVVLRPGSTEEVAAIVRLANELDVAIVPQGGNTGLVGGGVPDETGAEVLVSLKRLDRIRAVDPEGDTMIVEAGCVLEKIHQAAFAVDRLFPLSLGSQGSCSIGGNLSTNAGGTNVIAYGNARDLVLGLEVVLPTGEIWHGLKTLRKDNTGYDLKALFLGAEGTLGLITAAALKLFPKPKAQEVAFVAVPDPHAALRLLSVAKARAPGSLTAFEIMPRIAIDMCVKHVPGTRDPVATASPWYLLIEVSTGGTPAAARAMMESILEAGFETGDVTDATIAESGAQAQMFWHIRHGLSEAQRPEGGSIKHDVSVPVARVPVFLDEAIAAVKAMVPGCRPVPFGHMGDGNIHFNVSQPLGMDKAAFIDLWDAMNDRVHGIVTAMGGSISAEHGIGRLKRDALPGVKSPVELAMMRTLKRAFDPKGLMNPGRVLGT